MIDVDLIQTVRKQYIKNIFEFIQFKMLMNNGFKMVSYNYICITLNLCNDNKCELGEYFIYLQITSFSKFVSLCNMLTFAYYFLKFIVNYVTNHWTYKSSDSKFTLNLEVIIFVIQLILFMC